MEYLGNIKRKTYLFLYLIVLEFKRVLFKTKYFAEFDVTNNCNLRCSHCYHFKSLPEDSKTKELPIDVWEKRLKQLYKKGIRFVLLGGGEPTLRLDVIELSYKIFPAVRLITNGQIKIPQKFSNLIILLSLDGDREKNNAIRGEGTFEKVISNYSGDNRVIVNITLMRDNYIELEKIIKVSRENFFRGVVCNLYSGKEGDSLNLNVEERSIIIKELRRIKKIYPQYFLLTKSMINWYAKSDHRGYCYWGDEAFHLSSSWGRRRCFSGANCANCGCFAGALNHPCSLYRYPREAFKLI